jgi:signal transduction histidine kinase
LTHRPDKCSTSSISLAEEAAVKKNITFHQNVNEKINVFIDENMIGTVMRNLLSNAIKFTRVNGTIEINVKQNNAFAEISIIDNGIGISKKTINDLFRIDKKVSSLGTGNEQGTGLGLILCKEFAEKHGGKIWVESEEGSGSKFSFTIPIHK